MTCHIKSLVIRTHYFISNFRTLTKLKWRVKFLFFHISYLKLRFWVRLIKEVKIMWVAPASCGSFLMENIHDFGKGDKAKVVWKCSILALLWVIWQDRNSRIFEDRQEEDINCLWDRIKFLASLWASVSKEFQDTSFFFILLNWETVLGYPCFISSGTIFIKVSILVL